MKAFSYTFDNRKYRCCYITNREEALATAVQLANSSIPRFGLDLETKKIEKYKEHRKAGLCPHLSNIRLLQLYDGVSAVYVFDIDKTGLSFLSVLVQKKFIAHYGIFEIKHLTHNGYPNLNIGCSMMMDILIDRAEKSPFDPDDDEDEEKPMWKGHGLDACVGRLFNTRIEKKWQTFDWSTPELPFEAIAYAALDAILTYRVGEVQSKKIVDYKMARAYNLLVEMQHVIADMELNGMYLDVDAHNKLIHEWQEKEKRLSAECATHFGNGLNLNSSKQLGKWAIDKYGSAVNSWVKSQKTGALSFSANALASLQHLPEIKLLSEYKKNEKLLSTYGESLQVQIHPVTKRIHCSYTLGETRTGRLSSRDPNLQNLPREASIRDIFSAEKGTKLVLADFNQIELRVAGEVSKDAIIRGAYEQGADLHAIFAGAVYSKPPSHVSKPERQIAKSANFGAIYGMGPTKFIQYVLTQTGKELEFSMADHIIKSLWKKYATYAKWCAKVRAQAERIGFVRTPMGRMRKLLPNEVYTKAPNTIIQGGAFEVMAVAMIELRKKLPSGVKILNSVHDEVILEGEIDNDFKLIDVATTLEKSMEYGMKKVFPDATLNGLAHAVVGDRWGSIKAE